MDVVSNFLHAVGAVRLLRDRAWSSASFIEYNILSTYHIDALLRWIIFIKDGQNEQWLTKNLKERSIIEKANELNIFDNVLTAEDLHELYRSRNSIVHRFLITNIDYELSKRMAGLYEPYIQKLSKIVEEVENREMPVMEKADIAIDKEKVISEFNVGVQRKIGDDLEKINKVRAHKWRDVEDITDYVERAGYFIACAGCRHSKLQHVHFDKPKHPKTIAVGKCWEKSCSCAGFIPDPSGLPATLD